MKRILPGLYYFTGLVMGRVYLIREPDGLTIIDAGISLAANRIAKQLKKAGHRPRDVKRILITHAHPDHVGGLPRLKELTGASVMASSIERPVVEGKVPIQSKPKEKMTRLGRILSARPLTLPGTPVDKEIGEGDVLPLMGGLHVLATPGHAPGHISFWQPDKGLLICGDVIFNLIGLTLPLPLYTVDMNENKRSIKRLAGLEPKVVCFGHGDPLIRDTAAKIREFADRQEIE
jgi:glyoxylase-like metal-dependent hydrolase (beta-lactamase superfamily II)